MPLSAEKVEINQIRLKLQLLSEYKRFFPGLFSFSKQTLECIRNIFDLCGFRWTYDFHAFLYIFLYFRMFQVDEFIQNGPANNAQRPVPALIAVRMQPVPLQRGLIRVPFRIRGRRPSAEYKAKGVMEPITE